MAAVRPRAACAGLDAPRRSATWRRASSAPKRSRSFPKLPEMQEIHEPEHVGVPSGRVLIEDWRPEDKEFWETTGRAIARRNLLDLDPVAAALFRGLDGLVGRRGQAAGGRLHTSRPTSCSGLQRLPGSPGATLRIFYSFMVPIFGGRLWTTLTTWSLMIPARRHRLAPCRTRTRPTSIFLVLALLCGFGGGNFASSMANISLLLPEGREGQCAGAQCRARQSRRQRRAVRGAARHHGRRVRLARRRSRDGARTPAATCRCGCRMPASSGCRSSSPAPFAAWFGMNDIASAKASFAEQAVIFQRKHNWLMCWLYIGTFGSFIGYSAGFPLLTKTQFPDVECAHVRLPRPAGRRAVALGDRLGLRQVGRRPCHASGSSF